MTFRNSVVGGTTLVRAAIQSPNFVTGSAGWSIDRNGSAEFNNIVIRGGSGSAAVIIGPSGMPQVVIDSSASAGYIEFPTNRPIENDIATILAGVLNSGAANESASLQIYGPTVTGATDRCQIFLNSQNNDGSSQANMSLRAGSAVLTYDEDVMTLATARLRVTSAASANPVLSVEGAAGHTGSMVRVNFNGDDKLIVDTSGVMTTYADNAFTTYTPTVTNGGTATWTTLTGWYQRVGKMIFFTAYAVLNNVGSGAGNLTITAPTSIDRTTRQVVAAHIDGTASGINGTAVAVAFTSGSGDTFDRIRTDDGANITGANLDTLGATLTFTGWYREA